MTGSPLEPLPAPASLSEVPQTWMLALNQSRRCSSRLEGRIYLTGGATAVLYDWRATTIDVDIKLIPDRDEILREIPRLKEKLDLNVELAAPSDFIWSTQPTPSASLS